MNNERSKKLSYLLRHKPEAANLSLDKEGWCDLKQLVANTDFLIEELLEIANADSKQRYAITDAKIRANQGHSTSEVKLTFKKSIPPVLLFHGTTRKAYESIKKTGLLPQNRHHVHLSDDLPTAKIVAARRKADNIILGIDAKKMLADGIDFFISENGVWLVDEVKPKYITTIINPTIEL